MLSKQRILAVIAAATALAAVLTGCSSVDNGGAKERGEMSQVPEAVLAPDAEVTAGLSKLLTAAKQIAAAQPGSTQAKAAIGRLEPIWKEIEGTVKKNKPENYSRIEESLALLGKGDEAGKEAKTKVAQGASDMETAVNAYLAEHP